MHNGTYQATPRAPIPLKAEAESFLVTREPMWSPALSCPSVLTPATPLPLYFRHAGLHVGPQTQQAKPPRLSATSPGHHIQHGSPCCSHVPMSNARTAPGEQGLASVVPDLQQDPPWDHEECKFQDSARGVRSWGWAQHFGTTSSSVAQTHAPT